MGKIIRYCVKRRVATLTGFILASNAPMIGLCVRLGFAIEHNLEEDMIVASLDLSASLAPD